MSHPNMAACAYPNCPNVNTESVLKPQTPEAEGMSLGAHGTWQEAGFSQQKGLRNGFRV